MKRVFTLVCCLVLLAGLPGGCAMQAEAPAVEPEKKIGNPIVVGFSQVGAESEWRVANSESMKSALSEQNGYELIFDDARNEQENQIRAIRTFIQQDVDYIVFSPRVETGWNSILQEARDAKIPVIVIDRDIEVSDRSLYTAYIGSDFRTSQSCSSIRCEERITGAGSKNHNAAFLQMAQCFAANVRLGQLTHLDRRLYARGHTLTLQCVAQV